MKKILKYSILVIIILSLSILIMPISTIYKNNYIEYYDCDGNIIKSEIDKKTSKYVYLNELNNYSINAFIAYEDKNFYKHNGFDLPRIIKSLFQNIGNKGISSGASTITQQYARTVYLSNEKTLSRKLKEAYYTIKIENKYSKDEILEGYLNNIYMGHGCYGIECASQLYFEKNSSNLTLKESALLASLPSSPNTSSPINNLEKALSRSKLVLKQMLELKFIDINEYKTAINDSISISNKIHNLDNSNYYLDKVKREIEELKIPVNKSLKVYTNIDTNLHALTNNIIHKHESLNDETSLVILENNTNKVLVNIGGYNYNNTSYNNALYSSRPIGSTIKTFLYALALENNIDTSTKFKSEATTFHINGYGNYSPSNANNKYADREITMQEAFATSDNIYATKMLLLLGSENFTKYLKRFGLNTNINVPSIALGTSEFTLFNLTKAYSVFANNGYMVDYSFISHIEDGFGVNLYSSSKSLSPIISESVNSKIKDLLSLPFKSNNYYTKATMEKYKISNAIGKTGSTEYDSYVIAITEKYTIGIRTGKVDNQKFYNYAKPKLILKKLIEEIKKSA